MYNSFSTGLVQSTKDWKILRGDLDPGVPDSKGTSNGKIVQSDHLLGVLNAFRDVGAIYYIHEHVYIDRDFVHAYASFYHRTHRTQPKHCMRIHFFKADLSELEGLPADELAMSLEAAEPDYLGFAVLRPVRHAPVSWALVSADALMADEDTDLECPNVLIRATYEVHLLGAKLHVSGVPVNEQDSRTGSCAQSSIWSAARHLHKRYGEPWRSVVDITNAALTPTDAEIATQLPHGSARLSRDSMVRAMKNLGIQPLVYSREEKDPWYEPAHRIVSRYLDSGIPVIVGLERLDKDGKEEQHAVLAVGLTGHHSLDHGAAMPNGERGKDLGPATYDSATHLLVNDDQAGPYKRIGIHEDATKATGDWLLKQATFIMPAVPDGVFMRPENAESIARNRVSMMIENRVSYSTLPEKDDGAATDELDADADGEDVEEITLESEEEIARREKLMTDVIEKFDQTKDNLVCRTYLTPGWKYVQRMVQNDAPEFLKDLLIRMTFAKFVYVTEFAFKDEIESVNQCERRIRGHVVVDPTANAYDEPPITHVPGLLLVAAQELESPSAEKELIICILPDDGPYRPKVRGWRDYSKCNDIPALTTPAA